MNPSTTSSPITCPKCNITFSTRNNFHRHQRRFHSLNEIFIPMNKVCPVCDVKKRTIVDIQNHIKDHHKDINLKFENKTFYTDKEFKDWKSAFENSTTSFYTLRNTHEKNNKIVSYYACHRSGAPVVKDKSSRVKQLKRSGSVKIGKTCPAAMKVTKEVIDEAMEIVVQFQSTHVGHEHEVRKLRLTYKERSELAGMLKSGIPASVVIRKVKEQYSPMKRFGLLRRHDIQNIKRDFHICETFNVSPKTNVANACSNGNDAEEQSFAIIVENYGEQQALEKPGSIKQELEKSETDISVQKSFLSFRLQSIANQIQTLETSENLDSVAEHITRLEVCLQTILSERCLPTVFKVQQ